MRLRYPALVCALLLFVARSFSEGIAIDHQAVGCVVAGKFPQLFARFDPIEGVARARVAFRPTGGSQWYSVPMAQEGYNFIGVLPQPEKSLKGFDYYITVADRSFNESRTQEFSPDVVSGPGGCQQNKVLASALLKAKSILVNPPEGIANAAKVPLGFSNNGVIAGASSAAGSSTAASGAGTSSAGAAGAGAVATGGGVAAGAAAGAAAAGGLSGAAIAGIAVGGAAVIGGGVALATHGSGPTPPPPPSFSGTWSGQWAQHWVPTPAAAAATGWVACNSDASITLVLTQSGSTVTGTMSDDLPATDPCVVANGFTLNAAGSVTSGVVSGSSVTFTFQNNGGAGIFKFSGTLSGSTMTGTTVAVGGPPTGSQGTWNVTRQ
jgi:hypothetical protein